VSFKYMISTYFFINAIKKAREKHMLLKQHVFLTCEETHVNLICGLYKISYKPIYRRKKISYFYTEWGQINFRKIIRVMFYTLPSLYTHFFTPLNGILKPYLALIWIFIGF
jgi:hypothetical protein